MTHQPLPSPPPAEPPVGRVALLSVHTSPLDQPGTGDGGGLNVYVREVAARMAARGVEVDVFTRRTDPTQPDSVRVVPGVTVHHLAAGPAEPVGKEEVTNHLCAFLLALQAHPTAGTHDVLHAHYWLSGWVGRRIAPRWGVPLVQTFHTLGVLKNATLAPGDTPEPALRLHAEERVARSADRVLVLTCGEARLLHTTYGLSGARLTVVPAGVDLDRFSPRPLAAAGSVARQGTPELLFVGRLQPLKGPDVALRTLAEVRRSVPGARLRVVGGASGTGQGRTGPAELRTLAQELGIADAVTFEDAVAQSELAERYRAAAVLLAPSRSETFGLVALESQACGTPVVGADVPGLEAVVRGGGMLVPNHDPVEHAAAVVRLLTDPAHAAAARRAGLAAARAASWDRTVERLLAVYADVVVEHEEARGDDGGLPSSSPVPALPQRRSA
ncbi:MAG: glycosyltransferase [Nitriliruptoraceae bacterium]